MNELTGRSGCRQKSRISRGTWLRAIGRKTTLTQPWIAFNLAKQIVQRGLHRKIDRAAIVFCAASGHLPGRLTETVISIQGAPTAKFGQRGVDPSHVDMIKLK